MGAALHLTTAPELPKPKRGGGGGSEGYIDTVRRIYEDPRADASLEQLQKGLQLVEQWLRDAR